jgi:hypothetical protein
MLQLIGYDFYTDFYTFWQEPLEKCMDTDFFGSIGLKICSHNPLVRGSSPRRPTKSSIK